MFATLKPGTQCRCASFPSPDWTGNKVSSMLIRTMDITEGSSRTWLFRLQFESFQGRHRLVFKRPTIRTPQPLWEWTKEEDVGSLSAILQPQIQLFYPTHALWVIVLVGYEDNKQWKTKQFTFHVLAPSDPPVLNIEFRKSLDRVSSVDRWKKWETICFCSLFSPKVFDESVFLPQEEWKYEPPILMEGQQRVAPEAFSGTTTIIRIPDAVSSDWFQVFAWVRQQLQRWPHEPQYMIEEKEEGIFEWILRFFVHKTVGRPPESCNQEIL